jgi:hypothetical protein
VLSLRVGKARKGGSDGLVDNPRSLFVVAHGHTLGKVARAERRKLPTWGSGLQRVPVDNKLAAEIGKRHLLLVAKGLSGSEDAWSSEPRRLITVTGEQLRSVKEVFGL